MIAICIRCGEVKRVPQETCPACAFHPDTEEHIAKSFILSSRARPTAEFPLAPAKLQEIGERIRRGGTYDFDPGNVASVIEFQRLAARTPISTFVWQFLKFIAPALLAIGLAGYLFCRH